MKIPISQRRSIQAKENKIMKIALIAPVEESVPPKGYGGIEIIVYYLAQVLTKKGHEVFLLATGDSKTNAKLISIFPQAIRRKKFAQDIKNRDAIKYIGMGKIIKELNKIKVDIIHNHYGWRFLPFVHLFKSPVITTLHVPLNVPFAKFIYSRFKKHYYTAVSNSQRSFFPDLNYLATILNGVDVKNYEFNKNSQRDRFVFLGRISPEKGPVQSIQAAKMANVKLKMAAKIDIVDTEFFEKEVKPLIDGKQIEYIGEITQEEKNKFFRNALGMLVPIQWEDPCPVAFIESMACGVPVIAFDRGSARELINDGKTGFVVKNLKEMVEAIKNIKQIKGEECRKWVEKKFTHERMVDEYEEAYREVLEKRKK